jgi:hypothetical protein
MIDNQVFTHPPRHRQQTQQFWAAALGIWIEISHHGSGSDD